MSPLTPHVTVRARREIPGKVPRGFTLIEILVVLAIVATLLTFVTPRYYNHIQSSKEIVLRDNLRTTREIIDKFYGDLGRYPDSLEELVEKNYLHALPVDPLTESTTSWLIVAVPIGYKGTVYSITSGAPGNARDGKPYAEW
jgi:general secretion pathway protein G